MRTTPQNVVSQGVCLPAPTCPVKNYSAPTFGSGGTKRKNFLQGLAALSLEYRTQIGDVPDAAIKAGGERMTSGRFLEGDKWGLGETGEEVVSWGDRFGGPST